MTILKTTKDGFPIFEAKEKRMEGLELKTYTGHGTSHLKAINHCLVQLFCAHDYALNQFMRLRKCVKCARVEYIY